MATDLSVFGQQLRHLRRQAGLTQEELAAQIYVSPNLISNWERAYVNRGRAWKPERKAVLRLIECFAAQLTPGRARRWAAQAGHAAGPSDLQQAFPDGWTPPPRQISPLPAFYVRREELEHTLLDKLVARSEAVVALLGPGGTGKTTLAARVAQSLAGRFPGGVLWVQMEDVRAVQEGIARNLGVTLNGRGLQERASELRIVLRDSPCLIVLDDVWATSDLAHLHIRDQRTRLLITTRDAKVADVLEVPVVRVGGLSDQEGVALLAAWTEQEMAGADELVRRFGGLPLALTLSGAQLRAGIPFDELLSTFQSNQPDLSLLDMDDPQTRAESLTRCFDLSLRRLSLAEQEQFASLGCFQGSFEQTSVAAVWGVAAGETRRTLHRLLRFALVGRDAVGFHLHPLLRDYACQQLSAFPEAEWRSQNRHAAWYIRHALYHPGVRDGVNEPPPSLDHTWPDVVAGVQWAATHDPQLAAVAALFAHSERPALLEAAGPVLAQAVEGYRSQVADVTEQATLHELLGDLYLLQGDQATGLAHFEQATVLWESSAMWLAGSRSELRVAGVHLLEQAPVAAVEAVRRAQDLLAQAVPVAGDDLEEARWLFYWFDMIYAPLVRWPDLPEEMVAKLADLAVRTEQPLLEARGVHIYRLWCTAEGMTRPPEVQQKGRELAVRAYRLWRRCGRRGRADDEISWSGYLLNGRYSRRAAARYARRRSRSTPVVSEAQAKLAQSAAIRWWLGASEWQRMAWLGRMLPRYLGARNCVRAALSPGSRAWQWVEDILNIGMMGRESHRLARGTEPPEDHLLNGPEWRVLSGQKSLPLAGEAAAHLVRHNLEILDHELNGEHWA